ncbi:hypothetical protein D7X33_25650 [Butyricicoccus sp. 1XD8-22]|nr:hypothetical protein D7X33_25650 [Butyricicoccus sp. 1XD8-22]
MKNLVNWKVLLATVLFILLSVWLALTISKDSSKENVDNINKIIHNDKSELKEKEADSFKISDINSDKIQEIVDQKVEVKLEELDKQKEAKSKEEKDVVVSRGEEPSGKWYIYEVTFYTAGYESTGKTPSHPAYGITASGNYVQEGVTAACPKNLEFGTKLYIEGFGYRVCEDRGSAITENRLDIYVESLDKALQLGRQKLKVKIIS